MTSSQRHTFHPLFTVALLVLGLFALAMAQNNPARSAQPANALDQILSGQGQGMISQPVTLSDVAVQGVTHEDIIWVGNERGRSVLVMLQPSVNPTGPNGNPTTIATSDQVRVTGHVLRAPSTQVLEGWGVSPADAARVQRQGVVVQAVTFEVLNHSQ